MEQPERLESLQERTRAQEVRLEALLVRMAQSEHDVGGRA